MSLILGVETSCDETAAAVVKDGRWVRSNIIASQEETHARYGGVVPELAARRHLEAFVPVVDQALETAGAGPSDLDAVAVATGPGLVGSLIIGLSGAAALAMAWDKPLVGVNHLEAHVYAAFLAADPDAIALEPPLVALIVSGGHTSLTELVSHGVFRSLSETRDDAAGEVFDKVARHMGLGYPGGPVLDQLAARGDPEAIRFPRAGLEPGSLDFSFSGLKTAVVYHLRESGRLGRTERAADVAASFQAAVVDVLVDKAFRALEVTGRDQLAVVGGVAANTALRRAVRERGRSAGTRVIIPEPKFCTDNAAMVAGLAHFLVVTGRAEASALRVRPTVGLGGHPRTRGRRTGSTRGKRT